MPLRWSLATPADAEASAAFRNTVADDLTARFGKGGWSGCCTARGIVSDLRYASICLGHERGQLVATLRLATKKPWAIDRSYFTPVKRPLYLTSMAVAPGLQRRGLGRQALAYAVDFTRQAKADALFLDAFDHESAGAGGFYRACGFREVGRKTYRNVPLIYFELLV